MIEAGKQFRRVNGHPAPASSAPHPTPMPRSELSRPTVMMNRDHRLTNTRTATAVQRETGQPLLKVGWSHRQV